MLLQRARDLLDKARKYEQILQQEQVSETWAARATNVTDLQGAFREPASRLAWFKENGFSVSHAPLGGIETQVREVLSLLSDAPASATPEVFVELSNKVQHAIRTMGEAVQDSWRQFVENSIPPVDPFVETLLGSPKAAVASAAREVKQLDQALHAFRARPSCPAPNQLTGLAADIRRRASLMNGLPMDLPQGIKEFMLKSSQGEATLADLSSEVLDWIRENGLLDSYFISPQAG